MFGAEVAREDTTVEAEVRLDHPENDETPESADGAETFRASYLDIFIRHSGGAILVEQKLGAAESVEDANGTCVTQLARYSRAFQAGFPHYEGRSRKYFLTPTGRVPHDDDSWLVDSHAAWVARLADLLDDEGLSALGRFNLLSLLWELLVGPLAMDVRLEQLGRLADELLGEPKRYPSVRRRAVDLFPHLDLLLRIVKALP